MSWLQNLFTPSGQQSYGQLTPYAANLPMPTNVLGGVAGSGSQIDPTISNLLGGIGGLSTYNLGGQNLGLAQGVGMNALNDPWAGSALSGAITGAGMGMGAAQNMYGAGGSIYNTAFDPQRDLYNRMLAQTTDAARANEMAAGLGTSPLGAYATSAAQNNFNIDWQNAQLQRMISGAGAASGLQAGAAPLFMQSAAMPYQTSQGIYGNQLGTLGTLGQLGIQAAQIPGQQIGGWQNTLGQLGGLQGQAFNQQQGIFQDKQQQFADYMNIINQQNAQAQQNYQNMVQGLQGIGQFAGSMFGMPSFGGGRGGFGGGGGGSWYNTPGLSPIQQMYGWGQNQGWWGQPGGPTGA